MDERVLSSEVEGWKPDKNIGGGRTPVKETSQQLSAEGTTEHQESLHPFRVLISTHSLYGGSSLRSGASGEHPRL